MVDDRPEDTGSLPDSGRPKRAPPTIDLEATEVSSETHSAGRDAAEPSAAPSPSPEPAPSRQVRSRPRRRPAAAPISPWIIAPVSGAVAAALVIGVGWMLGWPAVQPAAAAAPQLNAAAIDDLTARVAGLESKAGKPAVPIPRRRRAIEALEKSLAALRSELATRARKAKSWPPPSTR